MDILQRISRRDFLRTVALKSGTYDARQAKQENCYAFNCPVNAGYGEFVVHDILTFLAASILSSRGMLLRDAAKIVGPNWALLEALVEHVETGHGIETILPDVEQTYFACAPALGGGEPFILGGTWNEVGRAMAAVSERLGGYGPPLGFSVEKLLRLAHNNARAAAVEIRPTFVVPARHPARAAWLTEVAAYQAAAAARFAVMMSQTKRSKYHVEMRAKARAAAARAPA